MLPLSEGGFKRMSGGFETLCPSTVQFVVPLVYSKFKRIVFFPTILSDILGLIVYGLSLANRGSEW